MGDLPSWPNFLREWEIQENCSARAIAIKDKRGERSLVFCVSKHLANATWQIQKLLFNQLAKAAPPA